MTKDDLKRAAAAAAVEHVRAGEVLGVGTGSTANHFIDLLAGRPELRPSACVASSEATAERLRGHGFEVIALDDLTEEIGLYVDGADEFAPDLALIKGGGGALTREKIVAAFSKRFVCIVDASKRVELLGAFPLPVEVIPMAKGLVARELSRLGARPVLREGFVTDNGNVILDGHGLRIADPNALERDLSAFPGVVTCGLFALRRADVVLMATPDGVESY